MADDPGADDVGDESGYIDGVDPDALVSEDQLRPTPQQHERLKDELHGNSQFAEIKRADRRYLVVGHGGDDETGRRRRQVCEQLDERRSAAAFRLEDFGFTGDDLDLWAPAFDILSAMAAHVVGVLENFDGGHVWELGYLYHQQAHVRDVLWLLKRVYEREERMREEYDNGMAASHLAALEAMAGERVLEWSDEADLADVVAEIP